MERDEIAAISSDEAVFAVDSSKLPLIRWMDISATLDASGNSFADLSPIHQALSLSVAAVAARSVKSDIQRASHTVGDPSSGEDSSGSGSSLFQHRAGRQDLANSLLLMAKKKLEDARVFTDPKAISLLGVAALQMVHMLMYSTRSKDLDASANNPLADHTIPCNDNQLNARTLRLQRMQRSKPARIRAQQ